jgi:hypothetical protein
VIEECGRMQIRTRAKMAPFECGASNLLVIHDDNSTVRIGCEVSFDDLLCRRPLQNFIIKTVRQKRGKRSAIKRKPVKLNRMREREREIGLE